VADRDKEYWTDAMGRTHRIKSIDDDYLINIFGVLKGRKEKDMQFFNVLKELKKRGLK